MAKSGEPVTRAMEPVAVTVRRILSGTDDGVSAVNRAISRPSGAPGWFGPQSAAWQVHGSVATFLGGIRALLLQAVHPRALAGVEGHSSYREDPFGRLQRTGAFIAATTFGSVDLAERTVAAVGRVHERVRGTTVDGRPYAATDPELLTWVHIALVDSMLEAYLRFGTNGRLVADRYVADMAVVGAAMGVPDPPTDTRALAAAFTRYRPELAGGPQVGSVREFVLAPPLPPAARLGYTVLARAAEDSLPAWAHGLLGSPVRSGPLRRADHVAARALLGTLQAALVESPARRAARERLGVALAVMQDLAAVRQRDPRGTYARSVTPV